MQKLLLKISIYFKTRKCLRGGRYRTSWIKRLINSSSNFLFCLIAVAVSATVVHTLYQLPVGDISLKSRIKYGEIMMDNEVPLVAEAVKMRTLALQKSAKLQVSKDIRKYAGRFAIDLKLAKLIYDISIDEQVDPKIVFAVIWTESRFKPNCVGKIGEIGLMQVRYGTALTIDPGTTKKKLFDPAYNIRIGIKHLKDHLHFYRGDNKLALLAYNRGRGRVNELLSMGIDPANGYAKKVLNTRL